MFITITDLIVDYTVGDESIRVLDIAEWRVKKCAQVAISGPSGSGKSTLLNIIAGLQQPARGSIVVSGTDVTRLSEAKRDQFRADTIGYIFQNFNLLQGYTALENVLLGMTFASPKTDQRKAGELLDRVGLAHRMNHYPRELSFGEQQRVAIARALSTNPELILADEPTGSLDPIHSNEVISLLREVSADLDCTLIVVSHDQNIVSVFEEQVSFLVLNRAFKSSESDLKSHIKKNERTI